MGGEDRPPSQRHPPSAAGPPERRRQWQHIFGALLEMLQQRQRQVETLARDRKFLQDYVHLQHDRWASKAHLLESQISQMRNEEEMAKRVEEAKLGLMVALKQREASCYKELAEDADNDLQDFCECVESLSCEISVLKENLEEGKSKEADTGARECCDSAAPKDRKEEENNALGLTELRKWKQAYKKLSSTKEAEVSALLAEKDFVWHQLKKMESDYTGLLKSKQIEVDQANEALEKLQANVLELRSSTMDKDETIGKLKDDIRRVELEMRSQTREAQRTAEEIKKLHIDIEREQSSMKEKDDMIAKLQGELAKHDAHMRQCSNRKSRLSKESTLFTRSGGHSVTPTGRHHGMAASRSSCLPNGSPGSRTARTGPRQCSKRKSAPPVSMVGSPKLFPSTFKIPKLKNLSPAV